LVIISTRALRLPLIVAAFYALKAAKKVINTYHFIRPMTRVGIFLLAVEALPIPGINIRSATTHSTL
jgi:hypothetical protein